jgi:single-strand DNA-binding protein
MYQQLSVIGRLGRDFEKKGEEFGTFSVGCTEKWKDRNGAAHEKTEWFNCTLNGKRADTLGPWIKKGGMVHITGKMKSREYQEKTYWDVTVQSVTLLGKPGGKSEGQFKRKPKPEEPDLADIPF